MTTGMRALGWTFTGLSPSAERYVKLRICSTGYRQVDNHLRVSERAAMP